MDDVAADLTEEFSNAISHASAAEDEQAAVDPDFVDRGFTCETKKRFFVDDTGEQTVATLPQVETEYRRSGFYSQLFYLNGTLWSIWIL